MRFQSVTSHFLILFYGIVGLTGESLHYLLQEGIPSLQQVQELSEQTEHSHGYHHSHGPDYHVHYHAAHSSKRKISQAAKPCYPDDHRQSKDPFEIALQFPANAHTPHACPLLAIVANMKLGVGGQVSIEIDSKPFEFVSPVNEICSLFYAPRYNLARGPPLLFSA